MGRSGGGWRRGPLGKGPQVGARVVGGETSRGPHGRGPGEEEAEAVAGEVGAGAVQEPDDRETRQASDGAWTSLRGAERPVEDFDT